MPCEREAVKSPLLTSGSLVLRCCSAPAELAMTPSVTWSRVALIPCAPVMFMSCNLIT